MINRIRPNYITNAIALLGFCIAAGVAQAADSVYPTRPVRLVVPFAPGGGVDATARIIAPKLSGSMGQNWVVDNRTGAAGNIASELVARANPDKFWLEPIGELSLCSYRHSACGTSDAAKGKIWQKTAGLA